MPLSFLVLLGCVLAVDCADPVLPTLPARWQVTIEATIANKNYTATHHLCPSVSAAAVCVFVFLSLSCLIFSRARRLLSLAGLSPVVCSSSRLFVDSPRLLINAIGLQMTQHEVYDYPNNRIHLSTRSPRSQQTYHTLQLLDLGLVLTWTGEVLPAALLPPSCQPAAPAALPLLQVQA